MTALTTVALSPPTVTVTLAATGGDGAGAVPSATTGLVAPNPVPYAISESPALAGFVAAIVPWVDLK